jgi:hypothetical protein
MFVLIPNTCVCAGEQVEVWFPSLNDWFDGRVDATRYTSEGWQIEVYFDEDDAAAWLNVKDELIRIPTLEGFEDEPAEGGGAVNQSEDEEEFVE